MHRRRRALTAGAHWYAALPVGHAEPLDRELHGAIFGKGVPRGRIVRVGMHGEGSCFFHSVCYAMNVEESVRRSLEERQRIGQAFRCKLRQGLRLGRHKYAELIESHPDNMRRTAEEVEDTLCDAHSWADEPMIKWASEHLGVNILFLDLSSGNYFCPMNGDGGKDTVLVAWVGRKHFEPIVYVDRVCDGHVHVHGLFRHNSPIDAPIIRALHASFNDRCHRRY